MKYSLNNDNYSTFETIYLNTLKPRSFFIHYYDQDNLDRTDILSERYNSKAVTCLNGEWNFKFYNNPNDVPTIFDTDYIKFDKVSVPSVFQYTGYSNPSYVNTRYMFPFKPPYVPRKEQVRKVFTNFQLGKIPYIAHPVDTWNFVAVYQRTFALDKKESKKYVITFLGVAACLDLYINGQFVGYGEGSHNMHEYDITANVVNGINEVVVVVHRWCNGTYLECQDMFRNNGIFRDVLLREEEFLFDYKVTTKKDGNKYNLSLDVEVYNDTKVEAEIIIGNKSFKREGISNFKNLNLTFNGLIVKEWNSEKPTLYPLYIRAYNADGEIVELTRKYIGFKTIEIKEDKFFLNGQLIKIRGVNHHDTSAETGYYEPRELILKDILLAKEYNINTIRTSHYPPDPLLIELANKYGLYIIDENDLETHGTISHVIFMSFNTISKNLKWKEHYMDRIEHLYERDKNNVSIIMWSLGNEAGGYQNQDLMYAYLKERSDIPVHYESVIHSKRKAYDVASEMYPEISHIEKVAHHEAEIKELNDRPYILCEYAHAMGVGPGALEDYVETFYKYDNLMGGCIWEMFDHAVKEKNGEYTYGGDHNEYMHDGNFCCDGLFYPDRTPSTGALLAKYAYRPVIIKYVERNKFTLFNAMNFTNTNELIIMFTFNGGKKVEKVYNCEPLHLVGFTLDFDYSVENIIGIEVVDTLGNINRDQIIINYQLEEMKQADVPARLDRNKLKFRDGYVTFVDKSLVIDYRGNKLISGDYGALLYRAPTDNDINCLRQSEVRGHTNQVSKVVSTTYDEDSLTIVRRIISGKRKFLHTEKVTVDTNGLIRVDNTLKCLSGSGHLFRFANDYILEKRYDNVCYYGREKESYIDMKNHSVIKMNNYHVKDMVEPNIRPQESGNRCDVKWTSIDNGHGGFEFIAIDKPYELGVKPYTDKELLKMTHRHDEINTCTEVLINMFNMGIGTGSCGPVTLEKYAYSANKEYSFSYFIKPFTK